MPDITGKWLHDELRERGLIDDEHWNIASPLRTQQLEIIAAGIQADLEAELEDVRDYCDAEIASATENEHAAREELAAANARIKELESKLKGAAA